MSGLRINLSKCCLYGVGLDIVEEQFVAANINFKCDKLPFIYLGLPVGRNMARSANWNEVLDSFEFKLAYWKSKLL